jgi:hypothetical protein
MVEAKSPGSFVQMKMHKCEALSNSRLRLFSTRIFFFGRLIKIDAL